MQINTPTHLLVELLHALLHADCAVVDQRGLGFDGPLRHVHAQHRLSAAVEHPVLPGHFVLLLVGLRNDVLNAGGHALFRAQKPLIHVSVGHCGVHESQKRDLLALRRVHAVHLLFLVEFELLDALEALLEVRLHAERVLRLRKNFEQLVVGQELEAREVGALALQIIVQTLLHRLQRVVVLLEGVEHLPVFGEIQHLGRLQDLGSSSCASGCRRS